MIRVAATVVPYGTAFCFRDSIHVADELFDRLPLKPSAFKCGVYFRDVCLMMLAMMDLHRASVNVRF